MYHYKRYQYDVGLPLCTGKIYVCVMYACHCVLLQKGCLYDVQPPLCTAKNVLV